MNEPQKCSDDHCDNDGVAYLAGPSLGESGRCTVVTGSRGRQLWATSQVLAEYLCREHAEVYIGGWIAEAEALAAEDVGR